jgi:hypothetical protein
MHQDRSTVEQVDEPLLLTMRTDGTQISTNDGRRFHLRARDLKSVHPDPPTVEQMRQGVAMGHFIEGVHFVRTSEGRPANPITR